MTATEPQVWLRLEYTLTRKERSKASSALLRLGFTGVKANIIKILLLSFLGLMVYGMYEYIAPNDRPLWFSICGVIWIALSLQIPFSRKNRKIDITLDIGPGGMTFNEDEESHPVPWTDLARLAELPDLLVIYAQSAPSVHAIPFRAFQDPTSRDWLIATIRNAIQSPRM